MKPKLTMSLLALLLSSTLLFNSARAQAQTVAPLPTTPPYFNPTDGTPPPGAIASPTNGMNLNFIGAAMFPQGPTTFTPLTQSLTDVDSDIDTSQAIVLTQKDAYEKTIDVSQGKVVEVFFPNTDWKGIDSNGEPILETQWWLQQDKDNHLKFLQIRLFADYNNGVEVPNVSYYFEASSLGKTTLTFTLNSMPVSKTLVFHIKVVADDATTPAPAENNGASNDQ